MTESPLTLLQRDGFVVIPSFLSSAELTSLRSAAGKITALARAGQWSHIRTVGKQFPPWAPSSPSNLPTHGIWGVQHLLHPDLPVSKADRDAFAKLYFSPSVLGIVKQLLSLPDEENDGDNDDDVVAVVDESEGLVMELCNMLVRPDEPFALRWHRDDLPATATAEEEEARLCNRDHKKQQHAQWNLALYEDVSLVLVPGSHRRARTDEERAAGLFENAMPGQMTVTLQPGDIAFYDNNILHRGVYDAGKERMTLHGSVGRVGASEARARNVLQHGVGEWVDRCDFGGLQEAERRRAEAMRKRLFEMGKQNTDVGFSLTG
ncbi:hypothetical protein B0H63DRAFT_211474 [Podospora didyma]|uniref:Phytanoyl-CoA dioxygenase n=1 Tax=Podospora didyma TaxID=330526 RepID=A0AAE0NHQ0_9PEZI|nr:hypothetical protein B0H63DRAFT_211474 [Podospora didyma]